MKKQTVFIKRYPSKGELPKEDGYYLTQVGVVHFRGWFNNWIEYWLEEIELPSEEEIRNNLLEQGTSANYALYQSGHEDGANFILNHLKSNTNGNTIE